MMWDGKERRSEIVARLDDETMAKITEMHLLITDKDMGLLADNKRTKEAIWGNGKMGIKTQIAILWIIVAIIGIDSPIVDKLAKWILK